MNKSKTMSRKAGNRPRSEETDDGEVGVEGMDDGRKSRSLGDLSAVKKNGTEIRSRPARSQVTNHVPHKF